MHGDGGFGACEAVLWKRIWQFERQSLEVKIVCIISVWRFMPKARELNESELCTTFVPSPLHAYKFSPLRVVGWGVEDNIKKIK